MKPAALPDTSFETSFAQLVPIGSNQLSEIQCQNQHDISIDIKNDSSNVSNQITPPSSDNFNEAGKAIILQVKPEQKSPDTTSRPGSAGACKICLSRDQDATTGKMITPCACAGTMAYIHEMCLRHWITVQDEYLLQLADEAKCELCHYKYKMTIVHKTTFQWHKATSENIGSFLSCVGLLCGFVVLTVVSVWSLLTLNAEESSFQMQKRPFVTKIFNPNFLVGGICAILAFILFILLINNIRETFWISNMESWTIHDYQESKSGNQSNISQQQQPVKGGLAEQAVNQFDHKEENANDISPESSPARKAGMNGTFKTIISKKKKKKEGEKLKALKLTESN